MGFLTTAKLLPESASSVVRFTGAAALALMVLGGTATAGDTQRIELAQAQVYSEPLPSPVDPYAPGQRYGTPQRSGDAYRAPSTQGQRGYGDAYRPPQQSANDDESYQPQRSGPVSDAYRPPPRQYDNSGPSDYRAQPDDRRYGGDRPQYSRYDDRGPPSGRGDRHYSENEIVDAGHRFFGSVSEGLAKAVERLFRSQGRPNGYILGEDAGGAFVAGLRYGEGRLYTKDAGVHKVYWQGPSVGYDFGGEGSKTMVLVYNLRDPSDIYRRFGGVEGSAYVIGGVSVQIQKHDHVTLAPIRSGIGLRLGANIGYLKYTRKPTWNPF